MKVTFLWAGQQILVTIFSLCAKINSIVRKEQKKTQIKSMETTPFKHEHTQSLYLENALM